MFTFMGWVIEKALLTMIALFAALVAFALLAAALAPYSR